MPKFRNFFPKIGDKTRVSVSQKFTFSLSKDTSGSLPQKGTEIEGFLNYVQNRRNLDLFKISNVATFAVEFLCKFIFPRLSGVRKNTESF